jgi:hypothetical protein
MATIGLPLLARSLQEFQLENEDHDSEIAGVVFNHSSSYSSGPEGQQSIREVTKIAKEQGWNVCDNQVRYSATYAKSARERTPLGRREGDAIVGADHLRQPELFEGPCEDGEREPLLRRRKASHVSR